MRGAAAQGDHLADAVRAAAEAVRVDDLGGEALEALRRAAGASHVLLYRYDDWGVVRGVAGTLVPTIPAYVRELFDDDPVQQHLLQLPPEHSVILTIHDLDQAAYHRSAAYNEYYRRHD